MYVDLDGEQHALQSSVDELLASCDSDEDREMILQQFAALKARLVCVKNAIEHKAVTHDMLLECSQSVTAVRATLSHLHERLKDDELTAEELSDLQFDLVTTRNNVMDLEIRHLQLETLLTEAGITVRDRNTEVYNMKEDVRKLLSDVENAEKKLKLCSCLLDLNFLLSGAINNLNEMGVVYLDDVDAFKAAVKVSSFYYAVFENLFFTIKW